MNKEQIITYLPAECPWGGTLYWYDTIDSTNTHLKSLAAKGAPEGTIVVAGQQTHGRGRMGRSFYSPSGTGLYLSALLRPNCPPDELMHLTCATAVAVCDAIEAVAGFRPGVKWINDLVADRRKLGGILTELSLDAKTSLVRYAIIGIGINCNQLPEEFPDELRSIATSLRAHTGQCTDPAKLAAAIITSLWNLNDSSLFEVKKIMELYRQNCLTLGAPITVLRNDTARHATAIGLDDAGGLTVQYPDGSSETVTSGEVSVRGLWGYAE